MPRVSPLCFNGAAVFQPRRGGGTAAADRGVSGFNGAAVFQPRRARAMPSMVRESWCFNGAAVFQPRRVTAPLAIMSAASRLQWGRGLSTAERKAPDTEAQ